MRPAESTCTTVLKKGKKGKTLQTKASIAQTTKQNHVYRRWISSTKKEKS